MWARMCARPFQGLPRGGEAVSLVTRRCEDCGDTMVVREADIKRGWGRFCSKSCKAKKQTRRDSDFKRYMDRAERQ